MGLVGLTVRYGSAAVSVYSVAVAGTPSQPALNVEACETRTWVTEVSGGGPAGIVPPPPPPPHAVTSVRSATLPTPRAARMSRAQAAMKIVAGCSRHSLSAWILAAAASPSPKRGAEGAGGV